MSRILLLLVCAALAACGGIYTLPEAPAEEERATVHLDPAAEEREAAARYTEARRTLVALYEALGGSRWTDAIELLSIESRLLLSAGGSGNAAESLENGVLTIDGSDYRFDPIDLLLMHTPDAMEDSVPGESESETARRKEVFLVTAEEARRVVLILEADQWRVHLRRLPIERLDRAE
jgi:hypothetical protein